jgi:hypothetical protein
MGLEVLECSSEEEAKAYAHSMKNQNFYPAYFFPSETSGEKLYEEFYSDQDIIDQETYHGLGIIQNKPTYHIDQTRQWITELKSILQSPSYDKSTIISGIQRLIPSFSHIETGLNLDQKM